MRQNYTTPSPPDCHGASHDLTTVIVFCASRMNSKPKLLLVDADPRSVRILEVSLRNAGYELAAAMDGYTALELLPSFQPDVVLCDTKLPKLDGFELVASMKRKPQWRHVPFVFVSSDPSVEHKIRGLELGVDDYLNKPVYIQELIARVHLVLQRKQREELNAVGEDGGRFSGALRDMGLLDLLQTFDTSRKSGVVFLASSMGRGAIYFRDGKAVDAELGPLKAERAIYRFLLWDEGRFDITFRPVRRDDRVRMSAQALLMECLQRVEQWNTLRKSMPPLDAVCESVDGETVTTPASETSEAPSEGAPDRSPSSLDEVRAHLDGARTLYELLFFAPDDEFDWLKRLPRLFQRGLARDTGRRSIEAPSVHPDVSPQAGPAVHPITPRPSKLVDSELIKGERIDSERTQDTSSEQVIPTREPPPRSDSQKEPPADKPVIASIAASPTSPSTSTASAPLPRSVTTSSSVFVPSDPPRRASTDHTAPVVLHAAGQSVPLPSSTTPVATQPPSQSPSMVERAILEREEEEHEVTYRIPTHRGGWLGWTLLGVAVLGGLGYFTLDRTNTSRNSNPASTVDSASNASSPRGERGEQDQKIPTPPSSASTDQHPGAQNPGPGNNNGTNSGNGNNTQATPARPSAPIPQREPPSPTVSAQPSAGAQTALEQAKKLVRQRKYGDAVKAYKAVLTQYPSQSSAMSGLAIVYLEQDNLAEALRYAEQATTADAANAEGWLALGAALEGQGKRKQAQDAYRSCVELGRGRSVAECKNLRR
jgi:CheY-like chemotaxis protein